MVGLIIFIFAILCAVFKWQLLGTILCLIIVLSVLYAEIKGIEGKE